MVFEGFNTVILKLQKSYFFTGLFVISLQLYLKSQIPVKFYGFFHIIGWNSDMCNSRNSVFVVHSVSLLFLYINNDFHGSLAVIINILISFQVIPEREYFGNQGL